MSAAAAQEAPFTIRVPVPVPARLASGRSPADAARRGARRRRPKRRAGAIFFSWMRRAELSHVRVAERVSLEDLRGVLEDDQGAGGAFGAFQCHGSSIL
jgi:hypothetical protein